MVGPGQGRGHQACLGAALSWVGGDLQLKVEVVHPGLKIVLENVLENIHHKVRVFYRSIFFRACNLQRSSPGILGFREENRKKNKESISISPSGIKIITWYISSKFEPALIRRSFILQII
jgi:hypothetical protein